MEWKAEDFAAFRMGHDPADLPRCSVCDAILRPHVLWFDERYDEHDDYQFARVIRMAQRARLVVFAGTSFSVGVTDLVLDCALATDAQIFSIDPAPRGLHPAVEMVIDTAETALSSLAAEVGAAPT